MVVKFFSGWKGKQFLASQLKIKKLKSPYPQLFFSFLQKDRLLEDCVELIADPPPKIIKAELQKYGLRAQPSQQCR